MSLMTRSQRWSALKEELEGDEEDARILGPPRKESRREDRGGGVCVCVRGMQTTTHCCETR